MDFLQTIFKTNIFLSRILEIYMLRLGNDLSFLLKGQLISKGLFGVCNSSKKSRNSHNNMILQQEILVLQNQKVCKKVQKFMQYYDPIKRTFSTSNQKVCKKVQKFTQ
jgi:hypothetical protein